MKLYYVFDDEQTAIEAELYIRTVGNAPIIGVNAKTGEPAPDKQKTERWAVPQQRLDGKWVFEVVPEEMITLHIDSPQDVISYFNTTFPNTVEEYSSDWFEIQGIE